MRGTARELKLRAMQIDLARRKPKIYFTLLGC
jgi:hypothetical protein